MDLHTQTLQLLEEQLNAACARKAALEREIQLLSPRIEVQQTSPTGGIHNLPVELLGTIFDIGIDGDTRNLQDIRLVCASFNHVILNTTQLWSYIRLTVPSTPEDIIKCTEFCSICIERSGRQLLDVSLTYSSFPTSRQLFQQLMETVIDPKVVLSCEMRQDALEKVRAWFVDGILRWWEDWRLRAEITNSRAWNSAFKAILNRIWLFRLTPLSTVVGKHGEHMSRWRSFRFSWPNELWPRIDSLNVIFPEGIKIYPYLVRFHLRYLESSEDYDRSYQWRCPIVVIPSSNQKLEEFATYNFYLPYDTFPQFNPLTIHRLILFQCFSWSLKPILTCQNLQYLHIGHFGRVFHSTISDLQPVALTRLTTLRLGEFIPPALFQVLDACTLRTLILESCKCNLDHQIYDYVEFYAKGLLPSLQRLELQWEANSAWREPYRRAVIKFLLTNAPLMDTVAMYEMYSNSFVHLISNLWAEGIRPGSLKHLALTRYKEKGGQRIWECVRTTRFSQDLILPVV